MIRQDFSRLHYGGTRFKFLQRTLPQLLRYGIGHRPSYDWVRYNNSNPLMSDEPRYIPTKVNVISFHDHVIIFYTLFQTRTSNLNLQRIRKASFQNNRRHISNIIPLQNIRHSYFFNA